MTPRLLIFIRRTGIILGCLLLVDLFFVGFSFLVARDSGQMIEMIILINKALGYLALAIGAITLLMTLISKLFKKW